MRKYLFLAGFILCSSILAGKNVNILDYGAIPDGKSLCTNAIQSAIDECSATGGGRVIVPQGTFLTGTLFIKNGVLLWLDAGAVILGSTNMADYKPRGVIRSSHQKNVGMAGYGIIDGQGWAFWEKSRENRQADFGMNPAWNFAHKPRSSDMMVQFENCQSVRIEGVTLKNSESWTLHLLACDDVLVTKIKIRNPQHGPNTDGIDINASRRVIISDCDIYTTDDAIVFKNKDPKYWDRACEDIIVTGCILTTSCNAFKIGTETIGDFRNIVFSNSIIKAGDPENELSVIAAQQASPDSYDNVLSPRSGISLETVDGSNVSNITVSNIVMEARVPIFLRLGNRGRKANLMDTASVPGTLKNIIISGIVAYNASTTSSITGLPGYNVENVKLDNIIIHTRGGGDEALANKKLDEAEKTYPNATMWGHLPASGLFVRHVNGLEMSGVNILLDETDMRPLVIYDDVNELFVDNLETNDFHKGKSLLRFTDVSRVNIVNCDFSQLSIGKWMDFNGRKSQIRLLFPFTKGLADFIVHDKKQKDGWLLVR